MAKEHPVKKSDDFQELRQQATEGNLHALGEVLNSFRGFLLRYSHRYIPKDLEAKIDAWDVVQETFVKATANFHLFKGKTRKQFVAWIRVILKHVIDNLSRDYRRSKRDVRREIPLSRPGAVAEKPLLAKQESAEEVKKFSQVFSGLPEMYRQALYLRNYEELSYKEIAARLGGTAEAVRKLHERALKRFLQEWKGS